MRRDPPSCTRRIRVMTRPMAWSAAALTLIAAGTALALAGASPDARPAKLTPHDGVGTPPDAWPARETPYGGLVARLPHIGTLTWRCDDEQRFFTKLTLETPGASVTAGLTSDGETVFRGRQVHPLPPPRHGSAGPFGARRTQRWTIRYHHKPATLKVVARLRFAAPRPGVECLVS